jgi:hypothetical protein
MLQRHSIRWAPAGDLAIGLAALAVGILLLTGVPGRRAAARRADRAKKKHPGELPEWAKRALSQPRLVAAVAVGAVLGLPGAIYLTALHNLNSGHFSAATRVTGVIVFCLFEFTLLIVPAVLLLVRPARVRTLLTRARDWMLKDGKRTLAYLALPVGAYLTIRGLVSLLS